MKTHQQPNKGKSSDWLTPQWILEPLGQFDLDPCCPRDMPWSTAAKMNHLGECNGLNIPWEGKRVWLNPPFGKGEREMWMNKMAEHGNGIMLIPAATETEAFKIFVWNKASSVLFLNRRPHFHYPDGSQARANSGCSICLVGYGGWNDYHLERCGLGQFICGWERGLS